MTIRIGMITPSSNTCVEPATQTLFRDAADISVYATRIPVTRIASDDDSDDQFDSQTMIAAARLLADAKVDALMWNGTSGSWLGIEGDHRICQAIEDETGIACTTATLGVIEACRAFGLPHISLVSPYTADIAERIAAEFAAHGIDVCAQENAGLTENAAFAELSGKPVTSMTADATAASSPAMILCTNVDGSEAVSLEDEKDVLVIDSIAAAAWSAVRLVDPSFRLSGKGRLLNEGSARLALASVTEKLLAATRADRTTLRLDSPALRCDVQRAVAEATGPRIRPIRNDASLPQRDLNTVRQLEATRKPLVQNNFHAPPEPPEALRQVYGVAAQVLTPIEISGDMVGWISVHSTTERVWSPADVAAAQSAAADVAALIPTL